MVSMQPLSVIRATMTTPQQQQQQALGGSGCPQGGRVLPGGSCLIAPRGLCLGRSRRHQFLHQRSRWRPLRPISVANIPQQRTDLYEGVGPLPLEQREGFDGLEEGLRRVGLSSPFLPKGGADAAGNQQQRQADNHQQRQRQADMVLPGSPPPPPPASLGEGLPPPPSGVGLLHGAATLGEGYAAVPQLPRRARVGAARRIVGPSPGAANKPGALPSPPSPQQQPAAVGPGSAAATGLPPLPAGRQTSLLQQKQQVGGRPSGSISTTTSGSVSSTCTSSSTGSDGGATSTCTSRSSGSDDGAGAAAVGMGTGFGRKLVALAAMYMAACFTNTVIETLKEAICVTACGAEALPFLSAFAVLPASVAMLWYHSWLQDALPKKWVFHATLAPLLAFYALFATVLYPHHATLHFDSLTSGSLAAALPPGMQPLLHVASKWTFTAFFALADLFGPIAISVLFFGSAGEVLSVKEAEVVYPLVGVVANVAVVLAGVWTSHVLTRLAAGCMQRSVAVLVASCSVSAAVMCGCRVLLDTWSSQPQTVGEPQSAASAAAAESGSSSGGAKRGEVDVGGIGGGKGQGAATTTTKEKRGIKKKKQSFWAALSVVSSSTRIRSLFTFVASYGLAYKLFEVTWKGQLAGLFPAAADYQCVVSHVQTAVGVVTLGAMLVARYVFARFGWGFAASCTPVLMLLCGSGFFGLSLAARTGLPAFGLGPEQLAVAGVAAGGVAEIAARSTRYSLLEPSKEMKYMELSDEERTRGKASVDLLAAQVGKTGASFLIQAVLLSMGSLRSAMPVVFALFVCIIIGWLGSIQRLAREDADTDSTLPVGDALAAAA